MHIIIWFVILTSLFGGIGKFYDPPEDHLYVAVDADQKVLINAYVESGQAMQDRHIIKQNYDYSCGSAALATLLNYHLGEELTEMQVIRGLMDHGNSEAIQQRRAFSFLDMKGFVDALGYHGAGYRAELENLMEIDVPVILPIEIWDYKHFVVFQGIHDNRVFLADPWQGHTTYPVKVFEDMWYRKVIFMAEAKDKPKRNLLALSREDMRYMDDDMVLWTMFPPHHPDMQFRHEREAYRHLDADAQIYQR
jgi:uncharacterized protein